MPAATPTRQLIEMLLGEPLQPWVATRRATRRSWRSITEELLAVLDGGCEINRETLRAWFAEVDPQLPLGRTA